MFTRPHEPIYPFPTQQTSTSLMPDAPVTIANCQSENFTITIHITLKENQYLTNTNTYTNTHWPTPTDKIKPNSKRQKTGKKQNINKANSANQSETHSSKERKSYWVRLLKNKKRETHSLISFHNFHFSEI